MAKVIISTEEVKAAGTNIIDEAGSMYKTLTEIREIIGSTKGKFDSEGGDELRRKFEQTAAEFEKFKSFIMEYGEFLKHYSSGHVELDQKIEELAAMFAV